MEQNLCGVEFMIWQGYDEAITVPCSLTEGHSGSHEFRGGDDGFEVTHAYCNLKKGHPGPHVRDEAVEYPVMDTCFQLEEIPTKYTITWESKEEKMIEKCTSTLVIFSFSDEVAWECELPPAHSGPHSCTDGANSEVRDGDTLRSLVSYTITWE